MPNELEPCDMTDCCRTNRSSEDAALDDLIRRALQARIKRDACGSIRLADETPDARPTPQ